MLYTVETTYVDGFPHIGIQDENNHRWLINPSQPCPVEDEEAIEYVNSIFTEEVKTNFQAYLDSKRDLVKEEEDRIRALKMKAGIIIEQKYPTWKQLNIMREGSEQDNQDMNVFISKVRQLSNQAEKDGLWSNQVEWNNITTN